MSTTRFSISKTAALVAMVVGVAAGSYGVAAAASGSSSSSGSSTATAAPPTGTPPAGGAPWGHQRSDETLLTGDALDKVTAIAKEKVPGGTVVRVETDADGVAKYEAHMTRADGTPVTVYVDANFDFVSVQ